MYSTVYHNTDQTIMMSLFSFYSSAPHPNTTRSSDTRQSYIYTVNQYQQSAHNHSDHSCSLYTSSTLLRCPITLAPGFVTHHHVEAYSPRSGRLPEESCSIWSSVRLSESSHDRSGRLAARICRILFCCFAIRWSMTRSPALIYDETV